MYARSCGVCEGGASFLHGAYLEKTLRIFMFSTGFPSFSYFFFFYRSPSLCTVFYAISSNINEVLLINPSANVFVFGDFSIRYKDWLNYSGGTDRPSLTLL